MTQLGSRVTDMKIPYKDFGTIYTSLSTRSNKNLLVLIPGQSLSPLMFFDLPIYNDRSSIANRILENNFDIVYVEPVGYARGSGLIKPLYNREHLAEQINLVLDQYAKDYDKVVTSGFCSTTHPPLIAAQTKPVDGIFLLSPIFGEPNHEFLKKYKYLKSKPWSDEESIFFNSLENFIKNRLEDRSDSLIGGNHRVNDWENIFIQRLLKILPNNIPGEWTAVKDMLYDLWLYPAEHGNDGWHVDKLPCKVLCLRGQFDYESNDSRFDHVCKVLGDKVIPVTVPNTSHFGMWEKNYSIWADSLIQGLKLLVTD